MATPHAIPDGERYSVSVYDYAGEYGSWSARGFAEAFAVYEQFRARYRGKVVMVFNLDRCDYNTDGLTEDETDAIEAAL